MFFLLIFSIAVNHITNVESNKPMVPLKVLHELPSTGYNNLNGLDTKPENTLQLRMTPGNFSGPDHLKALFGRCFKHRDIKYEYVLCPYQNITQEDIQAYYEPYKGVLGVWLDWIIEDNNFVGWNMVEGSSCGTNRFRSTRVILICGASPELKSVTEPEKCKYLAKFQTPEVCGKNAMVVYPRLPEDLQLEWDEALTDKQNGDITNKGYDKLLQRMFISAGLQSLPSVKDTLMKSAKESAESPEHCRVKLEKANSKIIELEEELRMKEEIISELKDGKSDI